MDPARKAEIFRALIKNMLRKQGMQFDMGEFYRGICQSTVGFNERYKLSSPFTKEEFIELYLELMPEVFDEFLSELKAKLAELKLKSK